MTTRPLPAAAPRLRVRASALTLDRVYLWGAVVVAVAAALATTIRPNDFWWHLAEARAMVSTGAIPTVDTFTFSHAGEPFFNQMWLAQLAMYGLYRAGGLAAVSLGHAAAIGTAVALTARLCLLLAQRPRLAAVAILGVTLPLSMTQWAVRPQAYAFSLFVLVFGALLSVREPAARRWPFHLWLIPPAIALWANIHGSFALGLGLTALVAVTETLTALRTSGPRTLRTFPPVVWVALAAGFAAVINPRGLEIFRYVATLVTSSSVAEAGEWARVSVTTLNGAWYFATVLVVLLAVACARRRPHPTEAALVIAITIFGGLAIRNTVWLGFAAAPVLTAQAASMLTGRRRVDSGTPAANAAILGVMVAAAVALSPWVRPLVFDGVLGRLTADTPYGAVAHLQAMAGPPRRLFSDIGYSSYIEWAAPQQKVFMDTRLELYPTTEVLDYQDLSSGRHVEALLAAYDFDALLLSRAYQRPLIEDVTASSAWDAVHSDSESVLFLRR